CRRSPKAGAHLQPPIQRYALTDVRFNKPANHASAARRPLISPLRWPRTKRLDKFKETIRDKTHRFRPDSFSLQPSFGVTFRATMEYEAESERRFFKGWAKPGPLIRRPSGSEVQAQEGETLDALSGDFRIFQLKGGHRF